MMWLVFERLLSRSAADEMVRIFVANLRLLADLFSSSPRADDPAAILKIRRQREDIYRRFGEVNAQSDAVPFETGPLRAGDMAARDRIRRWQAPLRSFYLLEAPLLQFRIFASSDSKSRSFTAFENDFRFECSRIFLQIAESLENQLATRTHRADSVASLLDRIDSSPEKSKPNSPSANALSCVSPGPSRSSSIGSRLRSLPKASTMSRRPPSCRTLVSDGPGLPASVSSAMSRPKPRRAPFRTSGQWPNHHGSMVA